MTIDTPPDFAFEQTVRSHGWYLLAPNRWDARTETLFRTELLGGAAFDLAIRASGSSLEVTSGRSLRRHEAELTGKLTRMFQLELSPVSRRTRGRGCDAAPAVPPMGAVAVSRLLGGAVGRRVAVACQV